MIILRFKKKKSVTKCVFNEMVIGLSGGSVCGTNANEMCVPEFTCFDCTINTDQT